MAEKLASAVKKKEDEMTEKLQEVEKVGNILRNFLDNFVFLKVLFGFGHCYFAKKHVELKKIEFVVCASVHKIFLDFVQVLILK